MSMDRVFEDLEARMAHLESQEIRANAEELSRAERAQVALADRLRGALGHEVRLHGEHGLIGEGKLVVVGSGWVMLGESEDRGPRTLVPLASLTMIEGLAVRVRPSASAVLAERSWASMLRALARDRELVRVRYGELESIGRIAAVGRDTLDLAAQPTGERGAVARGGVVTVVLERIRAVCLA